VGTVRLRYGYAGNVSPTSKAEDEGRALSRGFWLYAASAALVAFGFADFPLIAYHYAQAHIVSQPVIPIFYAAAMGASGVGSLIFGRWFDRRGLVVLVPGIVLGAAVAPFVFLGGAVLALTGTLLWGVSQGVHDAIMQAAVAKMVPEHARARAYGIFTAIYGVSWFLGSASMGILYDHTIGEVIALSVAAEILALIPLAFALRAVARR
jgi:predicted MFS family arabinose efflux permease